MSDSGEHIGPKLHEVGRQPEDYLPLIQDGLERAGELGFDLQKALEADYSNDYDGEYSTPHEVVTIAASLAASAELDDGFFDRPALTVLLLGAANAWLGTERRAELQPSGDRTVASGRDALVDLILIAAGEQSGVVRQLKECDPLVAEQYADFDEPLDEDRQAANAYIESFSNLEMAAQVQSLLLEQGPGSLLEKQRERLGIPLQAEQLFDIRVLNMARTKVDLQQCGFVVQGVRQFFSEDTPENLLVIEQQEAHEAEQSAKAAPFLAAHGGYVEQFGAKFGEPASAWVRKHPDGSSTITFTFPYAYGLLNAGNSSQYAGIARHEATHGQRPLPLGPYGQLCLALEELRAIWNADGAGGHEDVVVAVEELSRITGFDVVGCLAQAAKAEDPLSSFLSSAAGGLGLRTLLLLTALMPAAYARDTERARRFVDLRFLLAENDKSVADAIVRDTLKRRGPEHITLSARAWLGGLARLGNERYLAQAGVNKIANLGITSTRAFYEQALLEAFGPPDPTPEANLVFYL